MLTYDNWFFTIINSYAGRWVWLDAIARLFLNDYFVPTLMAVVLLALWFEGTSQSEQQLNRRAAVVATLGTLLGNMLLKIVNVLYFRPRPFANHEVNLLFYQPTDSSFPSNAATIGFAIATGVWFHNRPWGWGLFFIATLFGLSRIFGGVHFPLDVAAGAGLGWFSARLVFQQKAFADALLGAIVALADKFGLL